MMSTLNVMSTLASTAQTTYSVFQIATGDEDAPSAKEVGSAIIMKMLFGAAGNLAYDKFKKIRGLLPKKDRDIIEKNCFDNSFVAGTKISTPEGLVSIENIKNGDLVLSFNEVTGENEYKKVTHLIRSIKEDDFVQINYGDEFLVSTYEHPFYLNGEWEDAANLVTGNSLKTAIGTVDVLSVEHYPKVMKVYNFTVEGNHTYYVGSNGVLVHNAKPCPFFSPPKTVRSPSGVSGNFTFKGYSYRIDTNRISPEEKFHVHIYKGRKEIAKVTANGGWLPMHGGKQLPEKPSTVPSIIRTEINELVRYVNRNM
jgi:hypothetical protein